MLGGLQILEHAFEPDLITNALNDIAANCYAAPAADAQRIRIAVWVVAQYFRSLDYANGKGGPVPLAALEGKGLLNSWDHLKNIGIFDQLVACTADMPVKPSKTAAKNGFQMICTRRRRP